MQGDLFDRDLRRARRDRAARHGPELFLLDRAFGDCLERLSVVTRRFRSALLVGCPNPAWKDALASKVEQVTVMEPGPLFARQVRGETADEDEWEPPTGAFDLCVAVGTLDTVNNLPNALLRLRAALQPDGLLIGAVAGGDSLPQLRQAMFSADQLAGAASAHVHPRIEAPTLAQLLGAAGFVMTVVDIDRVHVRYPSLRALVRDLRRMGATNLLHQRDRRPLSRQALAAAEAAWASQGDGGRTTERFEILHWAAWTPKQG